MIAMLGVFLKALTAFAFSLALFSASLSATEPTPAAEEPPNSPVMSTAGGETVTIALDPKSDTGDSPRDRITSDSTPTFVGSAPPRSQISIYQAPGRGPVLAKTIAGRDGRWSVTLPAQESGRHAYFAEAGKTRSSTISIDFLLWTEKPEIQLDSKVNIISRTEEIITQDKTLYFVGYFTFPVSSARVRVLDDDKVVGEFRAHYEWKGTVRNLKPGKHTFRAVTIDVAGNQSVSDPLVVIIVEGFRASTWGKVSKNTGFGIEGTGRYTLGYGAGAAGDFNGDGVGDLFVRSRSGAALIFGERGRARNKMSIKALKGTNGFKFIASSCWVGAVAGIGDVNADGYDDVALGCPSDDGAVEREVGGVYLVLGGPGPYDPELDLSELPPTRLVRVVGTQRDGKFGFAVSGGGDVNGDGVDDLVVGAPGEEPENATGRFGSAYVIFGRAGGFPPEFVSASLPADQGTRIDGTERGQRIGSVISVGGDFNDDGFDDVGLGSFDASETQARGAAHVVFGSAKLPPLLPLSALRVGAGFSVSDVSRSSLGYRVSFGGDVNGDGVDDILFGSNDRNTSAYVLFGKRRPSIPNLSKLGASDGFRMWVQTFDDFLEDDLDIVGDLNGDGLADLGFGLPWTSISGDSSSPAGVAAIAFGSKSKRIREPLLFSAPNGGTQLNGAADFDNVGSCVAGIGDINGDGLDDVAVCASGVGLRRDLGGVTILYGHRER